MLRKTLELTDMEALALAASMRPQRNAAENGEAKKNAKEQEALQ